MLALALVVALTYSTWVLAPVVGSTLDPISSFASELAAVDQPRSALYRAGDGISAALFVVLGVLVARRSAPAPWWRSGRLGGWALVAMGVLTLADSLLPLSCAPTADAACAAAEAARRVPLTHQMHTVTSTLVGTFTVAAASLLTAAAVAERRATAPVRAGLAVLCIVLLGATAWTLVAAVLPGWPLVGLAQRAQLTTFVLWLVLAGWISARSTHEASP